MKIRKKTIGTLLLICGTALILAAAVLAAASVISDRRAGETAAAACASLRELLPESPAETGSTGTKASVEIGGISYIGILRIPSLDLELPVLSVRQDGSAGSLPCHCPGQAAEGALVIFGSNNSSIFGKLSALGEGDQVTFEDVNACVTAYTVSKRDTCPAAKASQITSAGYPLVLGFRQRAGRNFLILSCS